MKAGFFNRASRAIQGRALGLVFAVAAAASHASAQTPGFVFIPPAEGYRGTTTGAMSPDGKVVWGQSASRGVASTLHFRWTAEGGRLEVPNPSVYSDTWVTAFSGDGSVGAVEITLSGPKYRAGRYSIARGFEMLPIAPGYRQSSASAVTRDGKTFGGIVYDRASSAYDRSRAFLWNESTGMRLLPRIGDADEAMSLSSMSADASVVYGFNYGSITGRPWKWTEATGTIEISSLFPASEPMVGGCSADGQWAVGNDFGPAGTTFVRWNKDGVIENLGQPLGASSASARRVSDDGAIVSGIAYSAASGGTESFACVWTQQTGNIPLIDYLGRFGLSVPVGTQLTWLTGMSADGKSFAGWATTADGFGYGFVATIPSPATLPAIALSFCILTPRRRR